VVWVGPSSESEVAHLSEEEPVPGPSIRELLDAAVADGGAAHGGAGGGGPMSGACGDAELGDVPPSPALSSVGTVSGSVGGVPRMTSNEKYTQGQLCVRLRIEPEGDDKSQLHISRHGGDVLQFHSFYRDVRNQLASANGWVNNRGRYEHVVPQPPPAP